MTTLSTPISLEAMHSLIQEKKTRRKDLYIFVVSGPYACLESNTNELKCFFKLLAKNINSNKIPSRFQLAVKNGDHWFGIDCYIKQKKLHLFILDAALHEISFTTVLAALPIKAKIFAYNGIIIQKDGKNCSFFTLDHLFRLSNREKHWQDLLTLSLAPQKDGITYLDSQSCPESLAFILKSAQDFIGLEKLPASLQNTIINKKRQTLHEKINQNTVLMPLHSNPNNKINQSIHLKSEKYLTRRAAFFKLIDLEVCASRQGFEIICPTLSKLLKTIFSSESKSEFSIINLINNHKSLIKSNIQALIDITIYCDLYKFFSILEKKGLIPASYLNVDHLFILFNKNTTSSLTIFKIIFERIMPTLSENKMNLLRITIINSADSKFTDYFVNALRERPKMQSCIIS